MAIDKKTKKRSKLERRFAYVVEVEYYRAIDVIEWCKQSFGISSPRAGSRWHTKWANYFQWSNYCIIYLNNDDDYLLFLLRWKQ